MAKDKFLIAPFTTGLQTDVKPWLIPDEAWAELENVYCYKGRIIKRPGSDLQNPSVGNSVAQLYSRLAMSLGNTNNVTGNFTHIIPGLVSKVGQVFAVGTSIFTVTALGAPATIIQTDATNVVINLTVGGGAANTITITGDSVHNLNVPVYFYPAEPVMGLYNLHQLASNDELTYGYDTQFAYQYVAGHWQILGVLPGAGGANQPAGAAVWSGTNSDFIWQTNWRATNANDPALYATNDIAVDNGANIARLYNGVKQYDVNAGTWSNFIPILDSVTGARLAGAATLAIFKIRVTTTEFVGQLLMLTRMVPMHLIVSLIVVQDWLQSQLMSQ